MPQDFDLTPFPRSRKVVVDAGRAARRRTTVLGLLDLDVTEALERLRHRSEPRPSLTAFLIGCIARAAAEHPGVHASRDLRGRLWTPRGCDVNVSVEVELEGRSFPMNHVVRDADRRTIADLGKELKGIKHDPSSSPTMQLTGAARIYLALPGALRYRILGLLSRLPRLQRRLIGTLGVTSVGMFGSGPARAIALQVHTLDVVLGATDVRPRRVEEGIEPRSMLAVTLMFDHDVVDGAPAARFAARLRELVESADGLSASAERD